MASVGSQALPSTRWPVEPYVNSTAATSMDAQTSTRQRDVRTDTARDQAIRDAGFDLVVMWQCEMPQAAKHLLGYYVDDRAGRKNKASAKGISKKHNDITWWRYVSTLQGRNHHAQNRGFRMVGGCMKTYLQDKLGLSANYDKRQVLPDGIHTEPISSRYQAKDI